MKTELSINRFDHLKAGDPVWARKAQPNNPYGVFVKTIFQELDLRKEYVFTALGNFIHSRIYLDINSNIEYSRKDFVLINHFGFSQWSKDGKHYVTPNNFNQYDKYCTWEEFSYPNGMSDEDSLQLYFDHGFDKFILEPKEQADSIKANQISKETLKVAKPLRVVNPKHDSIPVCLKWDEYEYSHPDAESFSMVGTAFIISWKSEANRFDTIIPTKKAGAIFIPQNLLKLGFTILRGPWTCIECKSGISMKDESLLWAFYCKDTGHLVHDMCRTEFYKSKNTGIYGKENIGLISEMPAQASMIIHGTMPVATNNKIATSGSTKSKMASLPGKKGLSALLPVTQKKGLSDLLAENKKEIEFEEKIQVICKAINPGYKQLREEFEWLKPENQRIFPFYHFTNFRVQHMPYKCDGCREKFEGNGEYDTAYFVMDGPKEVKIYCSLKHCAKRTERIYTYQEQIYGYVNPVELPKQFKDSIPHQLVFGCLANSDKFKINAFVPHGLKSIEECKKEFQGFNSLGGGGSMKGGWHSHKGMKLSWGKKLGTKPGVNLSETQTLKILNEILAACAPQKTVTELTAQKEITPQLSAKQMILDNANKVVKNIGPFGYNPIGICIKGALQICEINIEFGKVTARAEIAETDKGWAFGYHVECLFTYTGAGGHGTAISLNGEQYPTRQKCTQAAYHKILHELKQYSVNAPKPAAKLIYKAVSEINELITEDPDPVPQPVNKNQNCGPKENETSVATKSEIKKADKPQTKKQDPRIDLIKFRASHHTRLMASKIAIAKGMNLSDMLHYAMKDLGKDILTPEELEGII